MYALSASTGALLGAMAHRARCDSSPAAADGVVYITSDGYIHALSASNGAELWILINPAGYLTGLTASPVIANGVVYLGVPQQIDVYALERKERYLICGPIPGFKFHPGDSLWSTALFHATGEKPRIKTMSTPSVWAADLFLGIPTLTTVHQGDLLTYAFPVWNLGPGDADQEVLITQVPPGTTFDYIRISGTPGLGTCTTPPYGETGQIICHENASHGSEHHVDRATDSKGDGFIRDSDHRRCSNFGGYARSSPEQ